MAHEVGHARSKKHAMKLNGGFSTAFWIGLALGSSTNVTAVQVTDPVPAEAVSLATDALTDGSTASLTQGADPLSRRPDFSGHWVFNAKASDDPQEKLQEAMKAMQQARGGGRGMGGGSGGQGRGGGKGGGHQGRGSSGGMGGHSEMSPGKMPELTATPERLDITHEDPMLLIADENDQRRRIFTDFRGASVSVSSGSQQRVTVAGWEDGILVVETTMDGGTRLTQSYQINAETGQLLISAAARLAERQPVSFRLVYDRVKPQTDTGTQ
jgi:hypothetical protein